MTKTKSGAVRVFGFTTKAKSETSGSGSSILKKKAEQQLDSDQEEFDRDKTVEEGKMTKDGKKMEEDVEPLNFDLEKFKQELFDKELEVLEWREVKPESQPKNKGSSGVVPGNTRKTRLQTQKEKDAQVKISYPGGAHKDPRNNLIEQRKIYCLPVPSHIDTSHSDIDPAVLYDLKRQCTAPHISVEDLDKINILAEHERRKNPPENGLSPMEIMEKDMARWRAKLDLELSKMAIAFFNKKHNCNYELVETLGRFFRHYEDKLLHHCNFKARKCPSQPLAEAKLFFGEVFGRFNNKGDTFYEVRSCYVLDSCPTVRGCYVCPKAILHPKDKFIG